MKLMIYLEVDMIGCGIASFFLLLPWGARKIRGSLD
jgi:hypothetical protein